ncbi:MAG TPA: hypothetical protein VJZ25_08775 [Gemmatimonadaceae bacterium]|nr:hypothetical protein [Gemmatimonadaceae bacterium]
MADAAPAAPTPPAGGFRLDDYDAMMEAYDNAPPADPPAQTPRQATPGRPEDLVEPGQAPEGDESVSAEAEPQLEQQAEDDLALAARAKDWAERPDLPDEFLDKFGTARVDGEERQITVREAFEGYQRRAVTTQRLQEAAAVKQHYEQLVGGQRQMYQRWQNPESLESDLEDQNLGPQLDHIIKRRFREFSQEQAILDSIQDPNHKAFAARQFQEKKQAMMMARAREREARLANERAQQNDGQQQYTALVQRTTHQMAQLGPRALREVGLKDTPYVRSLLGREVRSVHKWGTDLTYELVIEAAKTAKDVWDAEHERAVTNAAEGRVRSRALPPRRASPNPTPGPAKPANGKRPWRLDDYDDMMREYDAGR